MKQITIFLINILSVVVASSQDFVKNAATAKQSYNAGKLEDAHFALQQMLVELDITIGKEVLKLLPAQMETMKVNTVDDNVTANIGFVGATVRRSYGATDKRAEINIISNSPMVGTLNALFNSPLMNFANNGDTKMVKVQGYKARVTKESSSDKPGYKVEIPFNSALVTITANNCTETQALAMANTLPYAEIAKLIQ